MGAQCRSAPRGASLVAAVALSFASEGWAASDPTPDPAEPFAKDRGVGIDVQALRGASVSGGLGLSRRLPSGSVR